MSSNSYLKGEKKLQAKQIIKTGMALRLRSSEILDQLAAKEIKISERTLRRFKLEIYQDSGGCVREIFANVVGGTLVDDLLSYEEMQRNCWRMYYEAKSPNEQYKALSLLQKTSLTKHKIAQNFSKSYYRKELDYTKIKDDLANLQSEGDNSEKEN